jgi:predicted metalloprotease
VRHGHTHDERREDNSNNRGAIAKGGDATIHDRTGLYLAIIAMVLSALCLGLFLMQTFLMPQIIDAKVQAGMAEVRAQIQEQVAQTKTDADAARVNARVSVDEIERMRTGLAAKGIIIPKPEH